MEKRRKIMLTVGIQGIFIILSVFYVVMMAPRGTLVARDSLDAYFHLTRIQALDNVWQSPINFAQWNHVGNATTLFYPWLTVLPALPLFHWLGPVYGFLVFLGLVTYTTLVAAFISYRKYRGNKAGAFLFALLYTFSFIRATSVLYRWGVGEYIAMIFVPPLFLAFRAVLQAKWQAWPYVALWFALIMYSHFLSAAITAVALIILFLGALVKHFGQWGYWRALGIRALRFAGLTLVLTMGYWGPLVEQELTQPLGRPAVFNVAKAGQSLQKLLANSLRLDLRYYALGAFLLIVTAVMVCTVWFADTEAQIIAALAVTMLMVSTTLFPWRFLQHTPLNLIQYPGRFLNLFVFFALLYLVRGLEQVMADRPAWLMTVASGGVGLGAVGLFALSARALWHTVTVVPATVSTITNTNAPARLAAFNQRDYYPVAAAQHYQSIEKHTVKLAGQPIKAAGGYTMDRLTWRVQPPRQGELDLPVLAYRGVTVWVDGRRIPSTRSNRGTVQVPITAGQHQVDVTAGYTLLAWISFLGSLLAGIWLALGLVRHHHRVHVS